MSWWQKLKRWWRRRKLPVRGGSFTHNSGTVMFTEGSPTITGDITFAKGGTLTCSHCGKSWSTDEDYGYHDCPTNATRQR